MFYEILLLHFRIILNILNRDSMILFPYCCAAATLSPSSCFSQNSNRISVYKLRNFTYNSQCNYRYYKISSTTQSSLLLSNFFFFAVSGHESRLRRISLVDFLLLRCRPDWCVTQINKQNVTQQCLHCAHVGVNSPVVKTVKRMNEKFEKWASSPFAAFATKNIQHTSASQMI